MISPKIRILAVFLGGAMLAVSALDVTPTPAQPPAGLDGKSFTGQMGKRGEKTGDRAELLFKDGKFRFAAGEGYGFDPGPYTSREAGGGIAFEAETRSAKEGTMKWKGTVTGGRVNATANWSKPGKPAQEFWYIGKRME